PSRPRTRRRYPDVALPSPNTGRKKGLSTSILRYADPRGGDALRERVRVGGRGRVGERPRRGGSTRGSLDRADDLRERPVKLALPVRPAVIAPQVEVPVRRDGGPRRVPARTRGS